MNETSNSSGLSDLPWPISDRRARGDDTPIGPGSDKAAPAVVGLLDQAVKGAHDTIDRLADGAAPVAQHLGERVTAAEDALQAKTDQLRDTRDEWTEGLRATVRSHPLACIAAAAALGLVIARLTR